MLVFSVVAKVDLDFAYVLSAEVDYPVLPCPSEKIHLTDCGLEACVGHLEIARQVYPLAPAERIEGLFGIRT